MSVQRKEEDYGRYRPRGKIMSEDHSNKVNLTDLMNRLNQEKRKERKNNLILSAAAVSAVAVLGIILTL
tara:strand:+ start:145 stop:351 length:207 start_codon:yes stop_codon:yes gene_type:complete